VVLYADRVTDSMRRALDETDRRRTKQLAYNEEHGITPETIQKKIGELLGSVYEADYTTEPAVSEKRPEYTEWNPAKLSKEITRLKDEMYAAAAELEFERAAELRDRIRQLESQELRVR
jgi:excinuclease ABC subunit B